MLRTFIEAHNVRIATGFIARRLRLARPNLPVLYMSGYNQTEPNPYPEKIVLFRKPFTGSALAQKLREVLDEPKRPIQVNKEG